MQGLTLDVVLPAGLGALLPNMRELFLEHCALTPAARTTALDAACSKLEFLTVRALSGQAPPPAPASPSPSLQQLATAQLRQLAKLPCLGDVELRDASCPTLFLLASGTQLTRLHLHESYRQCQPGTQTPTPAWRATLQHVGCCTWLRELVIPCATAEELGLVAPVLQQLRTLRLNDPRPVEADGDAVVAALLRLPQLTSLHWFDATWPTFRRWLNDRPCRWEHLSFTATTPQLLARLPLHSLKQSVEWGFLAVDHGTPIREVRAAVANATRRSPAGFRWSAIGNLKGSPCLMVRGSVDVPAVLRTLQPLLATLAALEVTGVWWDAGLVKALGEVLPRTCTRLTLPCGSASKGGLEQVARSLPWLSKLQLEEQEVSPEAVVAYVRLARLLKREGGEGRPQVTTVVVERPTCPQGVAQQKHRQAWEQAAREACEAGSGTVVMELVWGWKALPDT